MKKSMWHEEREATNASSGSTPAASDPGAGTMCVRAAVLALSEVACALAVPADRGGVGAHWDSTFDRFVTLSSGATLILLSAIGPAFRLVRITQSKKSKMIKMPGEAIRNLASLRSFCVGNAVSDSIGAR